MDVKAEKIQPYGDGRDKARQVEDMFDSISGAYDFMNRAMTLGIDKLWRRRAVKLVKTHNPATVADLATGTADLAIALARALPKVQVQGFDLSDGMLSVGRRKVDKAGLTGQIRLTQADCLHLPLPDSAVDAVTVAYGVRNFADLAAGYREMYRVLRPGGMVCVVELSTPKGKLTGPLYQFYSRKVIPAIGRMVSRDDRAYTYLPESIAAVPQGADMCRLLTDAGFSRAQSIPLTFGACSIYVGYKS